MTRATVLAAGGVLWRHDAVDPEVALVHRPAYDDWSLPKGKAKPGEHLLVTALREMAEETGHQARLGPYLTTVRYRVSSHGRPAEKSVTYWAMRAVGGDFAPSHEVDELRWLPVPHARRLVSSASDRAVLDNFVRMPRDTEPLLLVRHGATATPRRRLEASGAARPLSRSGRAQASALVPVLERLGVTGLLSADLPACTQTLAPFAAASGQPVSREAGLTRTGFAGNEGAVAALVRAHAAAVGATVVCGQQRVIAGILASLDLVTPLRPPQQKTGVKRGGWWLLHHRGGAVSACERFEPAV